MKKFTLALLAAGGMWVGAIAQPNITIQAPTANATSQLRAPNGWVEHQHLKGVYLIKDTELTALTASLVNSIGFDLQDGTGTVNNPGNITIYLENTTDATYQKGTAFSTATVGMTQVYSGNHTIPSTNGAQTLALNCTPQFTYTGDGIYVAYEWTSAGPFDVTQPATYEANNAGPSNGLGATSSASTGTAPDNMTISDFRPCFIWNAVNTATNEVGVLAIDLLGKTNQLDGNQVISALVRNSSIGQLANVSVSLNIAGANPFTDVQTIPTIAAGANAVVSFAPYSPVAGGTSTVTVMVDADDNTLNDSKDRLQIASCETVAINNLAAGSFSSYALGAGASTSGRIFSFRYTPTSNVEIEGVQVVVPGFANAGNSGKTIYPVLQDGTGNIISQGANVTITQMDQFITMNFSQPVALMAGTDYNIGVGMPTNGYFPVGTLQTATTTGYYSSGTTGGPLTPVSYGDMSIQGIVSSAALNMTVSASSQTVCNEGSIQITIDSSPEITYTLSPGDISNSPVTVTPVPQGGGKSGNAVFFLTGTHTQSGCSANASGITIQVFDCSGLNDYANYAGISLFPNPTANGMTSISNLEGDNTIEVISLLGQTMMTTHSSKSTATIDLSSLPHGQYLVKVANDRNQVRIFKVVTE